MHAASARVGRPNPEPFMLGSEGDIAYFFQEHIAGVNGKDAAEDHDRIWDKLGEYAKKIIQFLRHGTRET